jgi:hypothetical protein
MALAHATKCLTVAVSRTYFNILWRTIPLFGTVLELGTYQRPSVHVSFNLLKLKHLSQTSRMGYNWCRASTLSSLVLHDHIFRDSETVLADIELHKNFLHAQQCWDQGVYSATFCLKWRSGQILRLFIDARAAMNSSIVIPNYQQHLLKMKRYWWPEAPI